MTNIKIRASRSSIFGLPVNILAALVYFIPAAFGWIPVAGYFAWLIPISVFFFEYKSNFTRFCASQSFCISMLRLVFDVIFDSIRNVAIRTTAIYGASNDFINLWGNVANPGNTANVIGNIISILLSALCLVLSASALTKKMWRIPLICDISKYMTTELKPQNYFFKA